MTIDRTGAASRGYSITVAFRFLPAAMDEFPPAAIMLWLLVGVLDEGMGWGWARTKGDLVWAGREIEAADERSAILEVRRMILTGAEQAGFPAETIVFLEEGEDVVE